MKKRFLFGQVHREKALPPNQNQKAWETQDLIFQKEPIKVFSLPAENNPKNWK